MMQQHPSPGAAAGAERSAALCRGSCRRLELLIAPRDAMGADAGATLLRALGRTLISPRFSQTTCGAYAIALALNKGEGVQEGIADPGPGATRLIEGLWPEPLGLRLTVSPDPPRRSWCVESDRYGVRPVFYGFDRSKRPIVSTRPDVVAALIGARLSSRSLAEHLLVAYNLDNHSPFEEVYRLRPSERLMFADGCGFEVAGAAFPPALPSDPGEANLPWLETLSRIIAEALEGGSALELTGGVDSRLVLAIALHAGAKPPLAFTLGKDDDEDVRIARSICECCDIEHWALPVVVDRRTIASDGHQFVMQSGFASNACSYAWLPAVFARLAPLRTGQVGGCGGEFATGFHFPPLDWISGIQRVRRLWARLRLVNSSVRMRDIFGPDRGRRLAEEIEDTLLHATNRAPGNNRRAPIDGLYFDHYLTQRMPMASGGVLAASACWYQPLQPLMHGAYIEWGRTLDTARCADRALQMEIIHTLNPRLGELPYADHRRYAPAPIARPRRRGRALQAALGKIVRRVRRCRPAPDQGAPLVAEALVSDDTTRQSLRHLADRTGLDLRADQIKRMLGAPHAHAPELGVLISAGWAGEAAATLGRELRAATATAPHRRAA